MSEFGYMFSLHWIGNGSVSIFKAEIFGMSCFFHLPILQEICGEKDILKHHWNFETVRHDDLQQKCSNNTWTPKVNNNETVHHRKTLLMSQQLLLVTAESRGRKVFWKTARVEEKTCVIFTHPHLWKKENIIDSKMLSLGVPDSCDRFLPGGNDQGLQLPFFFDLTLDKGGPHGPALDLETWRTWRDKLCRDAHSIRKLVRRKTFVEASLSHLGVPKPWRK